MTVVIFSNDRHRGMSVVAERMGNRNHGVNVVTENTGGQHHSASVGRPEQKGTQTKGLV